MPNIFAFFSFFDPHCAPVLKALLYGREQILTERNFTKSSAIGETALREERKTKRRRRARNENS